MSHMEIDPLLKRGIKLLFSKSPDAMKQLKALADEALLARQRGGTGGTVGKLEIRRDSPVSRSRHSSPSPGNLAVASGRDLKRDHHSMQDEPLSIIPPKRSRLSDSSVPLVSPSSILPHTPSPTPSIRSDSSSRGGSRRSDESDQDDFNDIANEITSGINCTVCKKISFYSMNQLVECQECHLLYHQDCHKPPVSKADVTDPRRVWYCSKCTRSMRKHTSGSSLSNSQSMGSSTRSSSNSVSSSSKSSSSRHAASPSKSHGSSKSSPSKGSSGSSSSGGSSTRPSPFTNLSAVTTRQTGERTTMNSRDAKLSSSSISSSGTTSRSSANSSSISSDSSKNASSSSSCQPVTSAPSNTIMTAEKRMQMMKKKAAAKMAERRKI